MSTNLDSVNNFDDRLILLKQQYYDRGVLKKEIRSYEVSLWTLQDEFITVLKWSDVEQKGRIESPKLTLNVDGTQKFTFSIPMWYNIGGVIQDNPNWYTVEQGQLIMGLRKVKVIFNKGEEYETDDEEEQARLRSSNVFELLITKVTEDHANEQLRCNIECEGLAFHELGKRGYKLNLSQANYELIKKEWEDCPADNRHWTRHDGTLCTDEPLETVQFWCEQGCDIPPRPTDRTDMSAAQWYYDIQMNWGSFSNMQERATNKVYEEEYVSSWDDNLKPKTIESYREKARPVEVSDSNLYNITQAIAEAFGIYCRYEYGYDDNYHIISRQIIFYNNYFDETKMISFTYPYDAEQIQRTMDSTQVTTKMYVRPQDSDIVASGQVTIADCPANKTKEDYLLNFEYMHTCGAINDEQYNYIPVFEKEVRRLNSELEDMSLQMAALEKTKVENEAKAAIAKNSMALDQESIDYNTELYKRLDASDDNIDGYFSRVSANPYTTYIRKNAKGEYCIPLSKEDKGIDMSTLFIFRYYQSSSLSFRNRITNYSISDDSYDYPLELVLTNFTESFTIDDKKYKLIEDQWQLDEGEDDPINPNNSSSMMVYLLYKYKPQLYYDKVNQTWINKLKDDKTTFETANGKVQEATTQLDSLQTAYNNKLAEKNKLIKYFENMMGPALREGYWQPENDSDYGDKKSEQYTLPSTHDYNDMIASARGENTYSTVAWDAELFDDENKNYYEETALRTKMYYPCIRVDNTIMSALSYWLSNNKTVSFVFNNNYYKDLNENEKKLVQNCTIFALGSQMQLGFVVKEQASASRTVIPVLVLTGAQSMSKEQIDFMKSSTANPRIGIVNTIVEEGAQPNDAPTCILEFETLSEGTNPIIVTDDFLSELDTYCTVYPRIKISSNELNTSSITLHYNNKLLTNYTDYMILSRTVTRTDGSDVERAYLEYFITIKPEVLFKSGSLSYPFYTKFTLSNASTCIYLDAQKVMEDSSKPRASYSVSVNALKGYYLKTLYRNLTQIIMINDTKLKFENVFGYISELDLDLDAPWNDQLEVKNYKTKFEDLFSTIVASSESMRQNQSSILAAAEGTITPQPETVLKMVIDNSSILQNYLDTGIEDSARLKSLLADIFTEAGSILASSNDALNEVRSIRNGDVLSGFLQNIQGGLTPRVINSKEQPIIFKVGDIWNQLDDSGNVIGRYVATSSAQDSANGFTRTYDGSLASIKGAALEVDTVAGTVNILASNRIDMKSGGDIYIAANENVDIVGNKNVNIGGTTINIGSTTIINKNNEQQTVMGGINLVAAAYDEIANINESVSMVKIKPDNILFGVTGDDGAASAVKITKEFIVMGVGGAVDDDTNVDGTYTGLIGAKFTKDSIGFATAAKDSQDNDIINAIIMNDRGITLGSGTEDLDVDTATLRANGSAVRIAPQGIDIGSSGYLYISTNNFIINSDATGNEPMFNLKYPTGDNSNPWGDALLYSPNGGLYVHGNIVNDKLIFVNTNYEGYAPGMYLTDSITYDTPAFTINNTNYYAWRKQGDNSNQIYYCTYHQGAQFTITNISNLGTIYTDKRELVAVAPKYAPKPKTIKNETYNYSYLIYEITSDTNGTLVKVNGNTVEYDGSSSPTSTWYTKLSDAQKRQCVIEQYKTTGSHTVTTALKNGDTLIRNSTVTFSVVADTGAVTIGAGQIADFNISPTGLTDGNLSGCDITNSNISSGVIEGYDTGLYSNCFYDYSYSRNTGLLKLRRINKTWVTIDIKTLIETMIKGGSTNDNNNTGGSGGAGCSGCEGYCADNCSDSCSSSCTGTCSGGCSSSCTGGCSKGCKNGCEDNCAVVCAGSCGGACGSNCGYGCGNNCTGNCTNGCNTTCTNACAVGCASGCATNCGNACSTGCANTCAVNVGPM